MTASRAGAPSANGRAFRWPASCRRPGLDPRARYVVFDCADELEKTLDGTGLYYESIDLVDAFHPQTILAYGMNGQDLPVAQRRAAAAAGRAPARLQAGQIHHEDQAVETFADLGQGNGGFWEDRGYEWYAGI